MGTALGFVQFDSADAARSAIEQMDNAELCGSNITVQPVKGFNVNRGGGGGGYGGGGGGAANGSYQLLLSDGGGGGGGGGGSSWAATGPVSCGTGCSVTLGTPTYPSAPANGGSSGGESCFLGFCDSQTQTPGGQGSVTVTSSGTAQTAATSEAFCAPATGTVSFLGAEQLSLTGGAGAPGALPASASGTSGGAGGQANTLDLEVSTGTGSTAATVAYVLGCNGMAALGGPGFTPGGSSGNPSSCSQPTTGEVECTASGQGGGGGGSSALCLLASGATASACSLQDTPGLAFCATDVSVPPPATCLLAVAGGGGGGGASTVETSGGSLQSTGCSTGGDNGGASGPVSTSSVLTSGSADVSYGYADTGGTGGGSGSGDGGGDAQALSPSGYAVSGGWQFGYYASGPGNATFEPVGSVDAGGGGGGGYNIGYAGSATSSCGGGGGSSAWTAPGGIIPTGSVTVTSSTSTGNLPGSITWAGLSSAVIAEVPDGATPHVVAGATSF